MNFKDSFHKLGEDFFALNQAQSLQEPWLFLWNQEFASTFHELDTKALSEAQKLSIFSGSDPSVKTLSAAYAGHQFGHFVPQLGDGRAHLLGDLLDKKNKAWYFQLKGSGPNVFSRGGDGRYALGPSIREYVMSEAFYHLGIESTRALCLIRSGESIIREKKHEATILTRSAKSFVRIGSLEYFVYKKDKKLLKKLLDHSIACLKPELQKEKDTFKSYLMFFEWFINKQITLVCQWIKVGFIHGVMNTDNCSLSGETLDYGPCAMIETFDPEACFSSIDRNKRYSFFNQLNSIQWNLHSFAHCLSFLVKEDSQQTELEISKLCSSIEEKVHSHFYQMMFTKIGIDSAKSIGEKNIVDDLLFALAQAKEDYTIFFRNKLLASFETEQKNSQLLSEDLNQWIKLWHKFLKHKNISQESACAVIKKTNPVMIPRNHLIEKLIASSYKSKDHKDITDFLDAMKTPYAQTNRDQKYLEVSPDKDISYKTFCGT